MTTARLARIRRGTATMIAAVLAGSAIIAGTTATTATAATTAAAYAGIPSPAHLFGVASYWRSRASGGRYPQSAAMTRNLAHQVASLYGGVAAFNAHQYNVSFYTVGRTVPRVDVHWDDCQGKGHLPAGLYGSQGVFHAVPMPPGARPALGSDGELTVYSPSGDALWEFWQARRASDGWHACWGGKMTHVSTSSLPYFPGGFGVAATGLLEFAGAVSLSDVRSGAIRHVMSLAIPNPSTDVSWPAQRGDGGGARTAGSIPEGTRFRLDPRIDVSRLHLTAVGRMIARAAQIYGFVVTNRSGAVSVAAESGLALQSAGHRDPWPSLLAGTPDYAVLKNFPWSRTQAMPKNYGKP
ncbi:MAG: hypothetical protein QOI42_33 [Frankiaceae bacterium]|nr:hypothetical protein [Frankiaceae bacterium]